MPVIRGAGAASPTGCRVVGDHLKAVTVQAHRATDWRRSAGTRADRWTAAVNGLEAEEVQAVVDLIMWAGARAVGVFGDVSNPERVTMMIADTDRQLGGLHILVNNVGLQHQTPFLELDLDTWRKELAVGLDGPFLLSVGAAKLMARRDGGVILNVTSVHEHQPRPGYAAYCTAKVGLGMLTRELAPYGIRGLAVAPGAIETPIQGEQSEQAKQQQRAGIPAGRTGTAAEVADLDRLPGVAGRGICLRDHRRPG